MIDNFFFKQNERWRKARRRSLFFSGINLFLLSVVIFVYPEILAYALAFIMMLASFIILGIWWAGRKRRNRHESQPEDGSTYYHINP